MLLSKHRQSQTLLQLQCSAHDRKWQDKVLDTASRVIKSELQPLASTISQTRRHRKSLKNLNDASFSANHLLKSLHSFRRLWTSTSRTHNNHISEGCSPKHFSCTTAVHLADLTVACNALLAVFKCTQSKVFSIVFNAALV